MSQSDTEKEPNVELIVQFLQDEKLKNRVKPVLDPFIQVPVLTFVT